MSDTLEKEKPILTANIGDNGDLIPIVQKLYLSEGNTIYDVTFGKGVFWRNIDTSKYNFFGTDLQTGVDFCDLPYDEKSADVVVLDPPYMHGGQSVKASINNCYRNANTSHESVIRLYMGGILEAARVLKKGGLLWVKTQDEIESGKQRGSYRELCYALEITGFEILDTFVLVQKSIPAMRENYQRTARKNHSYLIIAKFRR